MKSGIRNPLVLALLLLGVLSQTEFAWSAPDSAARLGSLVKQWEAFERREFPEQATLRGHHEADDRLTDVSDSAVLRRRQFVKARLSEIGSIDPAGLTKQERLSRELLARQFAQRARLSSLYGNLPFGSFDSDSWLPFSSLRGLHTSLVTVGQATRFESPQDYENYLARLVVDTGLHRLDWTRRQAIDYLVDNAGLEAGIAAAEVDRYISVPGQALAYKMGELKIKALRAKAEAQLGSRFDLRRFHNAVLDDGPLPLDVLEQRIDSWIERVKARTAKKASSTKPNA